MGRVFAELCKSTERNDVSASAGARTRVGRDASVVTFVTRARARLFVCCRLRLLGLDLLYPSPPGRNFIYSFEIFSLSLSVTIGNKIISRSEGETFQQTISVALYVVRDLPNFHRIFVFSRESREFRDVPRKQIGERFV